MEFKKKAWIITSALMAVVLIWSLVAVHNSAIAAAKSNRIASKDTAGATCPFTGRKTAAAAESKSEPKSCCSGNAKSVKADNDDNDSAAVDAKPADDKNQDDQYTPEQIAKCPHLKALQAKKARKSKAD